MALERHSPMELVYECFAKLGLRYMCVLRDGQFAGVVSLLHSSEINGVLLLLLTFVVL